MDFRKEKQIGKDIEAEFEQLKFTGGFDHNYVTDGYTQAEIREIACARCEKTGIVMEVLSDCPCVQFYAGNFVEQEPAKTVIFMIERRILSGNTGRAKCCKCRRVPFTGSGKRRTLLF